VPIGPDAMIPTPHLLTPKNNQTLKILIPQNQIPPLHHDAKPNPPTPPKLKSTQLHT
jgi:hypothetical protein